MINPYQYGVAQKELLLNLINTANPGAVLPFTEINTALDVPTHANELTSIRVVGKNQYFGARPVSYRRLSLASLFKNTVVSMDLWSAGSTLTRQEVVDELNRQFGTAFLYTDFPNQTQSAGNATWTVVNGSLCYVGSVTVNWVKGKRPLSHVFTGVDTELAIRSYPGGNLFPPERKRQGEYFVYGADFSKIKSNIQNITLGSAFNASNPDHAAVLAELQALRPDLSFSGTAATNTGGLSGLLMYRYTLPQVTVAEANSEKYTNVLIIVAASDSWFQGRILLHYI